MANSSGHDVMRVPELSPLTGGRRLFGETCGDASSSRRCLGLCAFDVVSAVFFLLLRTEVATAVAETEQLVNPRGA